MFHHITGYHGRRSDAIYAFIPNTLSWLHVADLPEPMLSASSLALPSGDLVVVRNDVSQFSLSVSKASLKGKCHTLSVTLKEYCHQYANYCACSIYIIIYNYID